MVLICHAYNLFDEVSVQIFCPLKKIGSFVVLLLSFENSSHNLDASWLSNMWFPSGENILLTICLNNIFYSLNIFEGTEVLNFKRKNKKKKKKKMGSSVPPGSHVALVTSLQSNLIWKSSSVCFCWSYPWCICRTQASYCCRMFLSLDLSDVSLWLVWGYVFWAGIPQKGCCMLLNALYREAHDVDLSEHQWCSLWSFG